MSSIARPFCSEIIQAGSARPNKTEGQGKLNQSVASKYPRADFTPTITEVTQEGQCTVMGGAVQPPAKAKADFVPVEIAETVGGEFYWDYALESTTCRTECIGSLRRPLTHHRRRSLPSQKIGR
jgi:hypothetical protein